MNRPKWYMPVAVLALLWNLIGCAAYLSDVMVTPDTLAKLSDAERAMRAARPMWSVAATAIAVWCGAAGSVGLILRKRWATPLLVASLLGVIGQDVSFAMSGVAVTSTVIVLQGLVLAIAIALVLLARAATQRGWM